MSYRSAYMATEELENAYRLIITRHAEWMATADLPSVALRKILEKDPLDEDALKWLTRLGNQIQRMTDTALRLAQARDAGKLSDEDLEARLEEYVRTIPLKKLKAIVRERNREERAKAKEERDE